VHKHSNTKNKKFLKIDLKNHYEQNSNVITNESKYCSKCMFLVAHTIGIITALDHWSRLSVFSVLNNLPTQL